MKTTGLSLAVLALIGDTQAVKEARSYYLPNSYVQRSKNSTKSKALTADDYNYADKYDQFESKEIKTPVNTEEASQMNGVFQP
jgi:hypothetical protein